MSTEKKPKVTDAERTAMMKKMDEQLEEHFRKLEEKAKLRDPNQRMEGGWTEENWEEEMQKHPFFNESWKDGEELSPMMQGLQDLKYSPDENTAEELAVNYKEDGNFNFKCKKYRFAVASYTEGLKAMSSDLLVNTQLFTNRAAAQYRISNFRSSLQDCERAVRLTPDHMKAIIRGAQCCLQLKHYQLCQKWCDRGLKLDPQETELLKIRAEAVKLSKEAERNERKRALEEKKRKAEESKVIDAIKSKKINIERKKGGGELSLSDLEPCHPGALHNPVHIDQKTGELVFPVLFLYPEFGETDFIEEFKESETLEAHLEVMFGLDSERPAWDQDARYTTDSICVYLESQDQKLISINKSSSLLTALQSPGFLLKAGTPNFLLFVKGSKSHENFLQRHS